ncbi:hypothetical protein ACIPYS_21555 [Kitasatospora sp. NPDC089913]|uniref:hypothetical protein n=1 Tax=Kitasatospora sp. NPDC089913 TaxID=3364080 RepID=UPI00382C7F29
MTTARTARFAAVTAVHPGADIGDHWVNAVKAVSIFPSVSLSSGSRWQWPARDSARVSRLVGIAVAPRNALQGVTA